MEQMITDIFASRFRELCKATDQNTLSYIFGVTKNTFRQWMGGYSTPTVAKLIKLSEYFDVSTDYLLGLSNIMTKDESIETACKVTGLTESTINILKSEKNDNATSYVEVINILLEDQRGRAFFTAFASALKVVNIIKMNA